VYEKEKRNNPARHESAQEARELDDLVRVAWGDERVVVLGNEGSFKTKRKMAIEAILSKRGEGYNDESKYFNEALAPCSCSVKKRRR